MQDHPLTIASLLEHGRRVHATSENLLRARHGEGTLVVTTLR